MNSFDYEKVKEPEYFCEGRQKPHSDHVYYASKKEMERGVSSFRFSLDGLWKFHYARNYESTVKGFEQQDFSCKSWEDIYVPSHIQLEGYDAPQYVNVQYPWEGHEDIRPGEIPKCFNPTASYVKYFSIPEHMKGKRIFISFQGAESGLALWLNGTYVGYGEDSFTPSEFELTDFIMDGENKLAVQVFKWTAGSWCEDQDFYRFSGIFREVYLYAVPKTHIYDLEIRTDLKENLEEATVEIGMDVWGRGDVRAELLYKGDRTAEMRTGLDGEKKVCLTVKNPALWSAEIPCLYDLYLEIYDESGVLQEVILQKVGIRRFEMKNTIMMLNGKRIVFRGVNRHEFSSTGGRNVSEEELRKDLTTMKRNNINAIRTSHYPNQSVFYRLCDEYGFYVMDETNLETHGSWDLAQETGDFTDVLPHDKKEWLPLLLDRADSMYQRDKNHPCVLIWSCGNESFGGRDIYEMSEYFRKKDSGRLVHYEGVFHDRSYNGTSDMESQMYPSAEEIEAFLKKDDTKPFICCEYLHAMGNSCGAMHKYTELAERYPKYQGGFIWDYIDQSLVKKTRYGEEFQAYGGDFGERPTDYNFSGNGIVYGGDREPSPKMQEVKYNYQSIAAEISEDSVKIVNKNLFLNTEAYECRAALARNGKIFRRTVLETSVEPGQEKTYPLPFQRETEPGEYTVTVSFHLKEETNWAPAGYETAFGQYVYRIDEKVLKCSKKPEVIQSAHNIGVRGEHFEALFSILYGGLVSYKYAGRELLEAIPKPNFWRAPTDNDNGNLMPMRYAQWKIASMYVNQKDFRLGTYGECRKPEIEETDTGVRIRFYYVMPTNPVSECTLVYEVEGDGTVQTTLSCKPPKELSDMPEFGVLFKLSADLDRVEWYGLGEAETYADRKRGAKLGIYKKTVKENFAHYMTPQECGAKEEVRWAKVVDRKGRGMLFSMDEKQGPMMFSALPYSPHEIENALHPYELPPVHHTVVRAALGQMGVGGDDSWGACTQEEYLLKTDGTMCFRFCFKGI